MGERREYLSFIQRYLSDQAQRIGRGLVPGTVKEGVVQGSVHEDPVVDTLQ